jgi:serine/threonine protein kinase
LFPVGALRYNSSVPQQSPHIRTRLAAGLLDQAAEALNDALRAPAAANLAHPAQIGRYRILELLGEGGMGSVYHAEQQFPIHRAVALKVIKLGMDTREVIRRFETERQSLARMEHPNIARVLDADTDDHGRPYFVMEYVPGIPITRFADQNHLTIRQRLELFIKLCDAIAHAHTKAILHRDVKASNVLA